jgi:hypothetical protein
MEGLVLGKKHGARPGGNDTPFLLFEGFNLVIDVIMVHCTATDMYKVNLFGRTMLHYGDSPVVSQLSKNNSLKH